MVSIAVKTFGVCDFSHLVVTDWRFWFLALMTATRIIDSGITIRLTQTKR